MTIIVERNSAVTGKGKKQRGNHLKFRTKKAKPIKIKKPTEGGLPQNENVSNAE